MNKIKVEVVVKTNEEKLKNYKGTDNFKNISEKQWQEYLNKHDK